MKGIKQYQLNLDFTQFKSAQSSQQAQFSLFNPQQPNSGLSYDYQESYREYHATTINMSGTVTTEDGRAFAFTIDYKMENSFERTTNFSYRSGSAIGNAPLGLSANKSDGFGIPSPAFNYDIFNPLKQLPTRINGGQIAAPEKALNKSDIGKELLGSISGNVNVDLAVHDDDGNGVIDSKDAIWNYLRSWTGGERSPVLLSMWKIAAISLTSVKSPLANTPEPNSQSVIGQPVGGYPPESEASAGAPHVNLVV
jgi:hypothetical protein